ncbi:MAG: chalcone isomerase family protein [Burkholderiales bacterium]|nr:chalcone isomerase family protein [Burkholderiales bacterium]
MGDAGPLKFGTARVAAATALVLAAAFFPAASAMELEGLKLPEKIVLREGGPQLVLNGAGVRHKLMTVKVYVGALYLAARTNDARRILSDPGPKRVSMHVLIDELTAKELIASLNDAIAANHIPAEIALIETRLREVNRMMSTIGVLKRGAVVYIDFLPGTGTRITVDGEEKRIVPGEDFFRALLRIWIGAKPVDGRLRDALLGGGARRIF